MVTINGKGRSDTSSLSSSIIIFLFLLVSSPSLVPPLSAGHCVYVCMHVYMYICMYVCMYVWMDGWMDGWMDILLLVLVSYLDFLVTQDQSLRFSVIIQDLMLTILGIVGLNLPICMYVCMYVCMYLSIYLSIFLPIYLSTYLPIYLSICQSIWIHAPFRHSIHHHQARISSRVDPRHCCYTCNRKI